MLCSRTVLLICLGLGSLGEGGTRAVRAGSILLGEFGQRGQCVSGE